MVIARSDASCKSNRSFASVIPCRDLAKRVLGLAFSIVMLSGAGYTQLTFSTPVPLHGNASGGGDLRIAADGTGTCIAAWSAVFSRSADNGATWTDPVGLPRGAASSVTTDGRGHWLILSEGGRDDIHATRSMDDGRTWSEAVTFTSPKGRDGSPSAAMDGAGNCVVLWDTKCMGSCILGVRSTDHGATWSDWFLVDPTAIEYGRTSFRPQVATDGLGNWVAAWQYRSLDKEEAYGTDRDIMVARSTDGGATWTEAVPLNTDAATDHRSDYSPSLVTDGYGMWMAVWETDADFIVTRSTDNGATWTDPELISTGRHDDIYSPELATDGNGRWILTWKPLSGFVCDNGPCDFGFDYSELLYMHSEDDGYTWSEPSRLNPSSDPAFGSVGVPSITANANGDWLALWRSPGSENDGSGIMITTTAPPTVTGITRSDPNPTIDHEVTFTVTFREPVTGVDAEDFVAYTGVDDSLPGATVTDVSGEGTTYAVTARTGPGYGIVGLDLVDNASIAALTGKLLGGPGTGNGDYSIGEIYIVGWPDINGDGYVDVADIQCAINAALSLDSPGNADINGDGRVDALDVQLVVLAMLEL